MFVHNHFNTLLHPLSLREASDSLFSTKSQQKEKKMIFNIQSLSKVICPRDFYCTAMYCIDLYSCKFFTFKNFEITRAMFLISPVS